MTAAHLTRDDMIGKRVVASLCRDVWVLLDERTLHAYCYNRKVALNDAAPFQHKHLTDLAFVGTIAAFELDPLGRTCRKLVLDKTLVGPAACYQSKRYEPFSYAEHMLLDGQDMYVSELL